MRTPTLHEFLSGIDLFSGLPERLVADLASGCHWGNHDKNEAVHDIWQGLPSLGIVAEGELSVSLASLDGSEAVMGSLYPGGHFGLGNMFSGEPAIVTLRALCATSVVYLPKDNLRGAMHQSPELTGRILAFYNRKIRFLQERICLLASPSPKARVSAYILNHLTERGEFYFCCSKCDLCRHIGVARASLYRELEEIRSLPCVSMKKNKIEISDPDAFRRHMLAG
ncbi:MAG: Crp/Fnr family transcriptional regulator [Lachnospiraceae bacterium]|jgi:CRP-like cAMP-binding protein|nr:Crp/Fnr family transcriptional regulator [Lachnospiraceae bacterium]